MLIRNTEISHNMNNKYLKRQAKAATELTKKDSAAAVDCIWAAVTEFPFSW